MKHLLLSSLLFYCFLSLSAQQILDELEDVVYLNNGDVLRGQIVEEEEGVYIVIEMIGGSTIKIEQSKINRIEYEESRFESIDKSINYKASLPSVIRNGIVHRLGMAFTVPNIETDAPNNRFFFNRPPQWSLTYSLGYRVNRLHTLSVGSGFQHKLLGWYLPAFLEAETDFFHGSLSPTFSARATFLAPLGGNWWVDRLKSGNSYRVLAGFRKRGYSGNEARFLFGWQYAYSEGERIDFDQTGNFTRTNTFSRETGFIFELSYHFD
ncbi:MAG: hypothetical protein AAFP83_01735 [Bacteroidota bacterium]